MRVSGLKVQIIQVKSALSRSRIPEIDFTINPYTGCEFGCAYCYADFMRRFKNHLEKWGEFVDVKSNIAEILHKEIIKLESRKDIFKHKPRIWLSIVTDPYQPLEKKFGLTRACLEILLEFQYPVSILTRSPLVLRDVDLLTQFEDVEVGMSITTDNEEIRKIFEPRATTITSRIKTLEKLKSQGIKTYAFIGPILPMNPKSLAEKIDWLVDYVIIDKMNYIWKTKKIYIKHGLEFAMRDDYFKAVAEELFDLFSSKGIEVEILF